MWNFFLLSQMLWGLSLQSELLELLSATDQLFEEFSMSNNLDIQALKLMLRRTYNLNDQDHRVSKRSFDQDNTLVRDKNGVYFLNNVQDVVKIPVKFPNDINIFSSHNLLYITTLEANGTDPQNQLANDLVLFQYSSIQGIREIGRVPVLGGTEIAIYSFQNVTYIVSAEHEAEDNPDSFQGSTVYKMVERSGRIYLEKIQILNLIQPNDVKFWEHQDQLYLAVGTNMGNDALRTGIFIYRWMGYHFDRLQVIPGKNVKSVTPFIIGSFMYLAVANFQDEYGNPNIDSEIFQFNLQEMKFKSVQKIRTHGAHDFSYFKFEDSTTKESEHFLIVANFVGKNSARSLNSLTESVVYKFNNKYFIPFQSFKLYGVTQWLPVQGSNGEFLLLASHSYGVVGYQYDGWRFTQISLQFGQSSFGDDIKRMRTFQYFGDIFLTIADKNSYGNNVNLWKLSFSNKNDLEKRYNEVEIWCNGMSAKLSRDNFDQVMSEFRSSDDDASEDSGAKVPVGNLKAGDPNEEIRDELEQLSEKIQILETMLEEVEEIVENLKNDSESAIVIGSKEISSLEVKCTTKNCCQFKNLQVVKMNGEDLEGFLNDVVLLHEDLTDSILAFEHVVVDDDLTSSMVNGQPLGTLIDVTSTTFLNSDLVVNGTVFVSGDLTVNGLFDGIVPDKDHLLLSYGTQNAPGKLVVDSLKVKNLKLSGRLNGEPIENLMRKPEIDLENSYKELNVNNMNIEGLVGGYNVTRVFDEALRTSGNQEIEGDLDIITLEADEIIIDSEEISNISISKILRTREKFLCRPNPEENSLLEETFKSNEEEEFESPQEFVMIVEGFLKAKDISDETLSTSLLEIISNSRSLNDSTIDSHFEFSHVAAEELEAKVINDISLDSWVVKNSNQVQRVGGKKKFTKGIHVGKEVSAREIDGIDLEKLDEDVLKLDGDQIVSADVKFNTLTCQQIETNSAFFGNKPFDQLGRLEVGESITTDRLQMENLTVFGGIDAISWKSIVEDSVFRREDVVLGEKTIQGTVRAMNLNLSGRINDLLFEEFISITSKGANKIILDTNVTLSSPLNVYELFFEGFVDSTLKPDFQHEWLLQDETQIITGPAIFENIEMKSGSLLMNETINNISLRKLFTRSLRINQDTKIKYLFTMDNVKAERIDVGGALNGASFNDSVVRARSTAPQEFSGDWLLGEGLVVNGSFVVEGYVSGLNVTRLCGREGLDKVSVIVGGSVQLQQEPKIRFKVNGVDLRKKAQEVWMRTENATLKGQRFGDVEFQNKTELIGLLNNSNLTEVSKYYLSKTKNQVMSSDFEFERLVIENSCRMHRATVGGTVNGIDFEHWTGNVLLQDKDQVVGESVRFEIFQTSRLEVEGSVNGFDLSRDVLRLDVDDAVVEGEKTFQAINVTDLTLSKGRNLQGVDVDAWRENALKTTEDVVIKGDLTLKDATFEEPLTVTGKVNDVSFDSEHLLTTNGGKQVVSGVKRFDHRERAPMKIKSLEVSGPINGVDLDDLIRNQAYSDRDLVFSEPKTFVRGFASESVEVDGLVQGVNVSRMCRDVFNPVDVNTRKVEFYGLLNRTKTLINMVKGRAFYFDYFEVVQTLKPNVKAVVPTIDSNGNDLLAVFTPKTMRLMDWNGYSETFADIEDEGLILTDNITFVTSEVSQNNSFLYIETTKSAKILTPPLSTEIESTGTSCVASFPLESLHKSCIFIGQKWNSSRILCNSSLMNDLQTYQWLESKGSVQVAVLSIEDDVYIGVINKEGIFDKIENTLSIYQFDRKLQHFYVSHTLAEVNPVALSLITYRDDHFLVSAGGHLPESVHNSVLSIFKFNKRHKVFVRSQSIQVDTPVDVHFTLLPTSQLALYVLTSNPTKPFVVFLHKGVVGFVEETSGLSLYPGSNLYSFTDSRKEHFVVISGFGRGQILRAGFKGV